VGSGLLCECGAKAVPKLTYPVLISLVLPPFHKTLMSDVLTGTGPFYDAMSGGDPFVVPIKFAGHRPNDFFHQLAQLAKGLALREGVNGLSCR